MPDMAGGPARDLQQRIDELERRVDALYRIMAAAAQAAGIPALGAAGTVSPINRR